MDHRESIQAAVAYIEEGLSGELSLNVIAEQTLFSPWQFHRMFTFMVGMPVMAYVRARRLSCAARALMYTKRRMIEIALDAGYESQQAFTRAFVRAFGVTPGACRKSGALPDMLCLVEAWSYERSIAMDTKPEVVTIEDFWVAGMGVTTSVEENMKDFVIPKLWGRFMPFMEKGVQGRTDDKTSYGICNGDGERFRYLAGVPVEKDAVPAEGLEKQHVPGGRYAVFVHRGEVGEGKLEGLSKTLQYIYSQWLPGSAYEYDMDRVDFEKYGPAFCADPPEMELYIPIRKKQ